MKSSQNNLLIYSLIFFFHFKKKIKNEDALDMIGRDGPMSKNIFDSANEALKQVFT